MRFDILDLPTSVMIGGAEVDVRAGTAWPTVVRGSRYTVVNTHRAVTRAASGELAVQSNGGVFRRVCMKRNGECHPGPLVEQSAVDRLIAARGYSNGPVIITAHAEVIVWQQLDAFRTEWQPIYVGKANCFPGVDGLFPSALASGEPWFQPKKMSIWTGCMFKTGETWKVPGDARDRLHWPGRRSQGRPASRTRHPELIEEYLRIRPAGGRLYVVTGGHIWMNLRQWEAASHDIWRKVSASMQALLTTHGLDQRHPLILMLFERIRATAGPTGRLENGLVPVYLGKCAHFDSGDIPDSEVVQAYDPVRKVSGPGYVDGADNGR